MNIASRSARHALACHTLALLALAGSASAQFSLVSQDRRLDLGASFSSSSGFHDEPTYLNIAPDGSPFSDSHTVTPSTSTSQAHGEQSSTINPDHIFGSASVTATASATLVTDSRDARALSRIDITFTLAAPTHIIFDGSILTDSYSFNNGPAQPVAMRFKNLTTNTVLGEVQTGFLHGPIFEIGDPIHLDTTLPAGTYQIFGEANQFGAGARPPQGPWAGVGSFQFDLHTVPGPGTSVLAIAATGAVLRRRRHD